MKNSKFILGGAAFLLTVAGVFASKAAKTRHIIDGFTKASGSCEKLSVQVTATKVSGSAVLKTSSNVQTIFTSIACSNPLYTIADNQ